MPKFGEFLFGAPSKSFNSSSAPTSFDSLPQEAKDAFLDSLARGEELSLDSSLFTPASLTGEQEAALATLSSGLSPTSAADFQTGINTFSDPFEEQVVQNAIRDLQVGTQGTLSDITAGATEAGGFGGTRQAILESEAIKNLGENIGKTSSALRSAGFQSAADRTMADIGRSQDVATNLFGLGEVQRGINTATTQAPLNAVNFLAQLAQGFPTGGGNVSSGTSTGERKGSLGDIGKIAGGLAMFSDERLKENINKVGVENGYNIYEFAYKNNPKKRYRGVIAQEVQRVNPKAVTLIDGYLAVFYNQIGVKMEALNV